jgi:hypothetical protein
LRTFKNSNFVKQSVSFRNSDESFAVKSINSALNSHRNARF